MQVVSSHLGRRHQHAVFAREGLLGAPVEEECDVGVLLGLGYVELAQLAVAQHARQRHSHLHRLVRDVHGQVFCIAGQRDEEEILQLGAPVEVGKRLIGYGLGQLAAPVAPEVEVDHGIAALDGARLPAVGTTSAGTMNSSVTPAA